MRLPHQMLLLLSIDASSRTDLEDLEDVSVHLEQNPPVADPKSRAGAPFQLLHMMRMDGWFGCVVCDSGPNSAYVVHSLELEK